jgi:hypothetical protein
MSFSIIISIIDQFHYIIPICKFCVQVYEDPTKLVYNIKDILDQLVEMLLTAAFYDHEKAKNTLIQAYIVSTYS